jgi:hypothetical protein
MSYFSTPRARLALQVLSLLFTAAGLIAAAHTMVRHMPLGTVPVSGSPTVLRTGRWQGVYILDAGCLCSKRVAEHLMERARLRDIDERVIEAGSTEWHDALAGAGWPVERWSPERVRKVFGAVGAPVLVIAGPDGEIRYRGGVSRRRDARDGFHEDEIWNEVQAGRKVDPFPVFGCAFQFGETAGS